MTTAVNIDLGVLARELELPVDQVQRTLQLLDEGNTIPFITRYRKDRTGGLNEEQIQRVQEEAVKLRLLAERKQTILRSIETQGKLTPELSAKINSARTLKWLEDVYLPYKPKKQTLATIARQRGLEPLAHEILDANPAAADLQARAASCISAEAGLNSVEEVLQGVGHILAEMFSERVDIRSRLRKALRRDGVLTCTRVEPTERAAAESPPSDATSGSGSESVNDSEAASQVDVESEPPLVPSVPEGESEDPSDSNSTSAQEELAVATAVEVKTQPIADGSSDANVAVTTEPAMATEPAVATESQATVTPVRAPGPLSAQVTAKKKALRKQLAKERKKRLLDHAFKDYYNFREALSRLPPHRILAINRGERAKVLRVRIDYNADTLIQDAIRHLIPEGHIHSNYLTACARDSLQRLVLPSLERELRRELAEEAEHHAVQVFVRNLRKLLLQPPVRGKRVLAVDPGFRNGCKLAAVDAFGKVLEHGTIHLVGGEDQRTQARATLSDFIRRHEVELIAIGNGAGCRAAEQIVSDVLGSELAGSPISYVIVNEAGASVYSTSQVGRDELPHCDPMMRSAVSIGRRLQDPLSELVKINPANIGVGMYQHDMKLKHLRESLDAVVNSCVNFVGVELNSASPSLLGYVSGMNQLTARRVYEYRQQHGPFRNREQIKEVPGIGEATFVQAAGFLRISDGDNPLDATWIHPESYSVAMRVLERLQITLSDLSGSDHRAPAPPPTATTIDGATSDAVEASLQNSTPAGALENESGASDAGEPSPDASAASISEAGAATAPGPMSDPPTILSLADRLSSVNAAEMSRELEIGELSLRDILTALAKPGRDPRDDFSPPPFRTGIMKLDDLKPGLELQGTVLNVVDFGAFVDIGISDSALIHISKLADQFIRDPQEVVSVGDILKVWVIDVDKERRRVSLTAIDPNTARRPREPREGKQRRFRPQRGGQQPTGAGPPPPHQTPRPQARPQQRPPRGAGKKPPQKPPSRPAAPRKPKPVRPITPGMLTGKQPMRSFSDLMQFYEKKQQEPNESK